MAVDAAISDPAAGRAAANHPLDPLSGSEIEKAAAVIKASEYATETLRFVMISLEEPPKPATLTFGPLEVPARKAFVVAYDAPAKLIYEAVVDLGARASRVLDAGAGPLPLLPVRHMTGSRRWSGKTRAGRRRCASAASPTSASRMIDPWPAGYLRAAGPLRQLRRLICRPLTFMRSAPAEHGYARPVEGLIVTFDLDSMEVIDVEDHGVVPLPPTAGNYAAKFMFDPNNRPAFTEFRDDVKPIEITQPDGPSFTVDGWEVAWQKWSLRVGFNPREGLVAAQSPTPTAATTRPIMYRGVAVGDGGALRRHRADPLEQERLRHGRGRHGLSRPTRSPSAATASARSTTSTASSTTPTATRSSSRTPSACTRRTTGSPGSTPTSAPRRSRCAGPGGWSSR